MTAVTVAVTAAVSPLALPAAADVSVGSGDATLFGTVRDAGGATLDAICVDVRSADGAGSFVITDGEGDWTAVVPPGTYGITFRDCGARDLVSVFYNGATEVDEADPVTVAVDEVRSGLDAVLREGGSISGAVSVPDVASRDICVHAFRPSVAYDSRYSVYGVSTPVGDDGRYALAGLPDGEHILSFQDCGGGSVVSAYYPGTRSYQDAQRVVIAGASSFEAVTVTLQLGGQVAGRVSAGDGTPLPQICATAYDESGQYLAGRSTGADGRYVIPGVPAGETLIGFSDCGGAGFLSQFARGRSDLGSADPITVASGQLTSGVDATLVRGATISGTVTDATGAPSVGRCVSASGEGGFGSTSTDADGGYTIRSLPTGPYVIVAQDCFNGPRSGSAPTYAPSTTDRLAASTTYVTAPDVVTSVDITLVPGGSLSGRALAPDGAPLEGMCASVFPVNGGSGGSAETGPDGSYSVSGLPAGDYTGSLSDCSGGDRLRADIGTHAEPIAVSAGAGADAGTAVMALGGRVSGLVLDVRGVGIAAACVSAQGSSGQTDTAGRYLLRAVVPGTVTVHASDCSQLTDHLSGFHRTIPGGGPTGVAVVSGATSEGVDIVLADAGAISGRILKRPTRSLCVDASKDGQGSNHRAFTFGTQAYRLGDLPAATYGVAFGPCTFPLAPYRWFQEKASFESSNRVTVVDRQVTSGVDVDFSVPVADEPVRTAVLSATPSTGTAPLATAFRGAVEGGGNGPFSWVLDPGDGSPAHRGTLATADELIEISHTYTRNGVLRPALRITTPSGVLLSATAVVGVGVRPPGAPTGVTVSAGDGQISARWTAPLDEGEPALGEYVVEASPSGAVTVVDGAQRTATVTVPNGVEQSITVRARSAGADGPASVPTTATAQALTSTSLVVDRLTGDPLYLTTLAATVANSSGIPGTVRFTLDGAPFSSAELQPNGTALALVLIPPGEHSIVATYDGSAGDLPSTSTAVPVQRDPYVTSTIYAGGDRTVTLDDLGTIDVTVATPGVDSSTPTGVVEITEVGVGVGTSVLQAGQASVALSGLTVGVHRLRVDYRGDAIHAPSTATELTVTVLRPTVTLLLAAPVGSVVGQSVVLSALVTSEGGAPTGSVEFRDGTRQLGTASLVDGTARLDAGPLPLGTRALSATYLGDAVHQSSTSVALAHAVERALTSLELAVAPTSPTTLDRLRLEARVSVTLPGAATPTATIAFSEGGTDLGTAEVGADGRASLDLGAVSGGTHTYTATYAGDARLLGSAASATTAVTVIRGTVDVTVRNDSGSPLPGATVLVVLPDGGSVRQTTDSTGVARLAGLPDGSFVVYVSRSGHLPGKATVTTINGAATAEVRLRAGSIATASLTSAPMTPEEMQAVGIDPNDPQNQNVVEFTINLAFLTAGSDSGSGGYRFFGYAGDDFSRCPTIEGVLVNCSDGDIGGSSAWWSVGGYDWSASIDADGNIVFLVIPGKASWLKEFFTVQLLVANVADPDFTLSQGQATLALPDGLVLAPTAVEQSLTQAVEDIPGGEARAATWYVRGDTEGSYDLSASYAGVLQPFGDPVTVTARTAEPLKVWGASALQLVVDADDTAERHTPYRVRVGLRNVADVPVYNLSLELLKDGKKNYIYQPQEQLETFTAELAPGATLSREFTLVPLITGTLQLDQSFVGAAAGSPLLASEITSRPRVEPQQPGIRVVRAKDKLGFEWPAVPGATSYRVFRTPDDSTDFPAGAESLTMLPSATPGLLKGWIPATAGDEAFFAISPVVDGEPAMEQPMLRASASSTAETLEISPTYDIPSGNPFTCEQTLVPTDLTFTESFFGLTSYAVTGASADEAGPLAGSEALRRVTALVPTGGATGVVVTATNGVGDEQRYDIELDTRCQRENAVVLAMGLNSEIGDGLPTLSTRSHVNPDGCDDDKPTSGVDAFSDQAATNWCTDAANPRGNLVAHLVSRGYNPGASRDSPSRTLVEYSYNGVAVSCGATWNRSGVGRPTFIPTPYSKAETLGEIVTELSVLSTTSADRYVRELDRYRTCWKRHHGRDLRFSVVGHSLGGYEALAIAREAVEQNRKDLIENVVTVDGAVHPGTVIQSMVAWTTGVNLGRAGECVLPTGPSNAPLGLLSTLQSLPTQPAAWLQHQLDAKAVGSFIDAAQAFGIDVATVTNHRDTCLREVATINDSADERVIWDINRSGWSGIDAHSAALHSAKSPVDQPGFPLTAFLDKDWVPRHGVSAPLATAVVTASRTAASTTASSDGEAMALPVFASRTARVGPARSVMLLQAATGGLTGRIVAAPGGQVTGAQVVAVAGDDQHTVNVGADGLFEIVDLPDGDYRVFVQPFGAVSRGFWVGGSGRDSATVHTVGGGTLDLGGIVVAAPVTTQVAVRLPDGTPVPGAAVVVDGPGGRVAATFTGLAGTVPVVTPPGTYTVSVLGEYTTQASKVVDMTTPSSVQLEVVPAAVVEATMLAQDGTPLAGVVAAVYDGDLLVGAGVTGRDGKAPVFGLPAGNYAVRFYEQLGRFTAPTRTYAVTAVIGDAASVTVTQDGELVPPPGTGGGSTPPLPEPTGTPTPEPTTPTPGGGGGAVVDPISSATGPSSSATPSPTAASSGTPSPGTTQGPSAGPTPTDRRSGRYHPLVPARVYDSRSSGGPVVAGADRRVAVTGVGGVPSSGVAAVVVNLTSASTTAISDVQVYPTGNRPPVRTSNLNLRPGRAVASLVTTAVGSDGTITLSTEAGATHLVVDVVGWYGDGSEPSGATYRPLVPSRIADTRVARAPVVAGADRDLVVTGRGGVPSDGVEAVVVNVTGVGSTSSTDLQIFPTGARPAERTSNLNVLAGETRANLAVVRLGLDGKVTVSTARGATHVVLDVVGWYGADGGLRFVAASPFRLLDSRNEREALVAGVDRVLPVAGRGAIPATARAVSLSLTVVGASRSVDLQAYPAGSPPVQRTSNLNVPGPAAMANAAVVGLGTGGAVGLSLSHGHAHTVVDVAGWFVQD